MRINWRRGRDAKCILAYAAIVFRVQRTVCAAQCTRIVSRCIRVTRPLGFNKGGFGSIPDLPRRSGRELKAAAASFCGCDAREFSLFRGNANGIGGYRGASPSGFCEFSIVDRPLSHWCMNYWRHWSMRCFIQERVSRAAHECDPLTPPNCFECRRIFASKLPIGPGCDRDVCHAKAAHTIARRNSTTCAAKQELHAYRFTLGNLCGYQLPEIPHTYPIRPVAVLQTVTYLRSSSAARCSRRVCFR